MSIILVSDVFGKTSALIKLRDDLNADIIVDPYHGIDMSFDNEAEAYSYFCEQVGLDEYVDKLLLTLEEFSSVSTLIGFSVGASIIWRLSDNVAAHKVKRAICFYGSQIRNFTKITPQFQMELVFPKKEPHFDVIKLQTELAKKQNVKALRVNSLHGFMNYYSDNFDQTAYRDQVNRLCSNEHRRKKRIIVSIP